MSGNKINIRRLKDFAFTELPRSWILREIILSERDELDVSEFVAKAEIWLKLAKLNSELSERSTNKYSVNVSEKPLFQPFYRTKWDKSSLIPLSNLVLCVNATFGSLGSPIPDCIITAALSLGWE